MLQRRNLQSKSLGKVAEDWACGLLSSKGYKIIARNFRSKFGEIDIIAVKDGNLVFVEVKARFSLKYGNPEEAVTFSKLQKIKKTGEFFSLKNPSLPKKLRIEVVALELVSGHVTSFKIIIVD